MHDDATPPAPVKAKRTGCQWIVLIAVTSIVLAVISIISLVAYIEFFYRREVKVQPRTVLKDLQIAITSYEVDYGHYPIPEAEWRGPDVSLRTRGSILLALLGSVEAKALNPKEIKFIDLPAAKDRKFGLWQDGGEWVLSDLWGEPYYIILDTNNDEMVANPEFGAVFSDPKHAEFHQKNPLPQMLPLRIAIYSSGKDRDPKTWDDNVCSWRSH